MDPDRELAALRYEQLRAKLIKFFILHGYDDPEHLADQTIDIAVRNIQNVEKPLDVHRYLYKVAQRVSLENLTHSKSHDSLTHVATPPETETEIIYPCLEQCLAKLAPDLRDFILRYYETEASTKIKSRRVMAQELGISENALRILNHRIRAKLEKCITECLEKQQEEH